MSIKLKALGLGLLAMMAMSAFAAMNAGAKTDGHFVFGSNPTYVTGIHGSGTEHNLHFVAEDGSKIGCDHSTYSGKHEDATQTTTSLTITPNWTSCYTTPDGTKFDVHENECDLEFTSRAGENDATVNIKCPTNKKIVITHPNCAISVGPQEVGGQAGNGVTYTNKDVEVEGKKDWVTMHVKVSFATQYHSGICVFLGTNHTAQMEGSVTVTGFADPSHTVRTNITAT